MNLSDKTKDKLSFEQKTTAVGLLLACASVGEGERRQAIINELPPAIRNGVVRSSVERDDVLNLVNACLAYKGGVDELLKRVRFFEGASRARRALDEFWGGLSRVATFAEDGQPLERDEQPAPLEAFDAPSFLGGLQAPGGAVKLRDKLYVRREADTLLQRAMVQWGTTTTIRAARQTGKTSLLMRGIHIARQSGARAVFVDFQSLGQTQRSLDGLLKALARRICRQLALDEAKVQQAWQAPRDPLTRMTYFLEDEVLPACEQPLILALDEADSLLQTDFYQDFFGMVRSWHNLRASPLHFEQWEKLNLVLVISTEPYLLIDDINQSPFNVGERLNLEDFSRQQVKRLNRQHGSPLQEEQISHLISLLGGHPYLTRQALYTLVVKGYRWEQLIERASNEQGPFGQHLQRYYWAIHDKQALKQALKAVIRTQNCSDDTYRLRLLHAGLIKEQNGLCNCRCELYKQYFTWRLT